MKRQLKVYYIDDEPMLLEAFIDRFMSPEIHVQGFTKFMDLVKAVNLILPDVVFIDFTMPEKNGEEVARALPRSISKVLVTGNIIHDIGNVFECVFEKPFQENEIEKYLHEKIKSMK